MLLISDLSETSEPVDLSTVETGTFFSFAGLPNTLCIKVTNHPNFMGEYRTLIYNFATNKWDVDFVSGKDKIVVHQIEFER